MFVWLLFAFDIIVSLFSVTRLSGKHAKAGFSFYFARYNIDYSMGASRDSGATAMERRLHIFLIALSVLKFEWM